MSSRLKLLLVAAAILVVPFSLRAANRLALRELPGDGYLPSLEIRRERKPFEAGMLDALRRHPVQWIFIGDSMLGTRIDPRHLAELATTHDENVRLLMAPATGPAWWYLAFKNWVAASGAQPRAVFIFFRDTNLTDTMFRLESQYGSTLDMVAHDQEPELDRLVALRSRGIWARAYSTANRAYELDIARMWMEPAIRQWYTHYKHGTGVRKANFEYAMEQEFSFERLRKDVASDMSAATIPDFQRELPSSILPELMRLAREHHITVCFVRVQRRPVDNRPPEQSPELLKYVADLRAWIEANGGLFHDDTGDPEMTLDLYEDGDHFLDRRRYTEIFRNRLDPLFR